MAAGTSGVPTLLPQKQHWRIKKLSRGQTFRPDSVGLSIALEMGLARIFAYVYGIQYLPAPPVFLKVIEQKLCE